MRSVRTRSPDPIVGGRVREEGLAKGLDPLRADLQPGGGPVAAEPLEMLRAGPQPLEQVESGDAAPGAAAAPLGVE